MSTHVARVAELATWLRQWTYHCRQAGPPAAVPESACKHFDAIARILETTADHDRRNPDGALAVLYMTAPGARALYYAARRGADDITAAPDHNPDELALSILPITLNNLGKEVQRVTGHPPPEDLDTLRAMSAAERTQ